MMRLASTGHPAIGLLAVVVALCVSPSRDALAQSLVPNAPVPGAQAPGTAFSAAAQRQPPGRTGVVALPAPMGSAAAPPQLLANTEAAIDQQARGQFPVMDRSPSLPLGTLQRSWDRPNPASGQTAPGVVHYMWNPDFIMGVRTRDFMVTSLLLPPWEKIGEFYVGDPMVFEARKVRANVIALRSRNAGADSNLTVLGASGNVYNFYIRSETWNSTQVSDLAVYVEASRPDGGDGAISRGGGDGSEPGTWPGADDLAGAGAPDYLRRVVVRPEDLKFDMKMFARRDSDAEIAPERVFEDGVFTYFDFGERSDQIGRPVLHQVVDGVDAVVNTRTAGPRGNVLIAEAVGDFTLRNGGRVVCVRRISGQKGNVQTGENRRAEAPKGGAS